MKKSGMRSKGGKSVYGDAKSVFSEAKTVFGGLKGSARRKFNDVMSRMGGDTISRTGESIGDSRIENEIYQEEEEAKKQEEEKRKKENARKARKAKIAARLLNLQNKNDFKAKRLWLKQQKPVNEEDKLDDEVFFNNLILTIFRIFSISIEKNIRTY